MPGREIPFDPNVDLSLIVEAAQQAGEIALRYFRNSPRAWTKEHDSPVTEADIEANGFLLDRLMGARPDYGWLSEETGDTPDRLTRHRVFVVDPIDGTRGFIEGNKDWCVSVAIVEDGVPLAAALAVPAHEEWFEAVAGAGARLNGVPLAPLAPADRERLQLSGPARHARALADAGMTIASRRVTPSLAYRLALVAAGRIDLATAAPNAHDWDLAAADLLVHEAGGKLCAAAGEAIRYNRRVPRHPALVAGTAELVASAGPIVEAAEKRWHDERSAASSGSGIGHR